MMWRIGEIKKKVAFVCTHNSCRSQMAEAYAKKLGNEVLETYSAGTEAYSEVKPLAVQLMQDVGIAMQAHFPKLLDEMVWCAPLCPVNN